MEKVQSSVRASNGNSAKSLQALGPNQGWAHTDIVAQDIDPKDGRRYLYGGILLRAWKYQNTAAPRNSVHSANRWLKNVKERNPQQLYYPLEFLVKQPPEPVSDPVQFVLNKSSQPEPTIVVTLLEAGSVRNSDARILCDAKSIVALAG